MDDMKNIYTVYGVKDMELDEIVYVGMSGNVKQRWYNHTQPITWVNQSGMKLYELMASKGVNNFELVVISKHRTKEEGLVEEKKVIDSIKPIGNIRMNGDQTDRIGGITIYCKRITDGKELKFDSISEGARQLGRSFDSFHSAYTGEHSQSGGWLITGERNPDWIAMLERYEVETNTARPIRRINIETGDVDEYESVTQASKELQEEYGMKHTSIKTAIGRCNGIYGKSHRGYRWEYITFA